MSIANSPIHPTKLDPTLSQVKALREETGMGIAQAKEFFSKNHPGMTYWQWLAGMALQGFISNSHYGTDIGLYVKYSVKTADALIQALEATDAESS